jgi:hypothetical protein
MTEAIQLQDYSSSLKDFQRATVDYVFRRMYLDRDPSRRFLVADEVGLGKTLVARGVMGRAIEHLDAQGIERIDIIYICSNASIATQNVHRLNVSGEKQFSLASRITLLPLTIHGLTNNRLNFISLTPSTSLDLKHSDGIAKERALLYTMLCRRWPAIMGGTAPMNAFQGRVRNTRWWRHYLKHFEDENEIDAELEREFHRQLGASRHDLPRSQQFRYRLFKLLDEFKYANKKHHWQTRAVRNHFIGDLRALLARACVNALEPDLVILDEFQRFKHLLDGTDPASDLAQALFNYSNARVLLLSATPYKMFTLHEEAAEDDHYADFLRTLEFLLPPGEITKTKERLDRFRAALFRAGRDGGAEATAAKGDLERTLRRVMVRTERLAVTPNRGGMLVERPGSIELRRQDLDAYLTFDRVSTELDTDDVLEYWKSAPYLLNFMEGYLLAKALRDALEADQGRALAPHLANGCGLLPPWEELARWAGIDPNNPRLRALIGDYVDSGVWRLLWLPAALPYYRPEGPFAELKGDPTKRLVFSSWTVVPKAVAAILSYEVERRMVATDRRPRYLNTPEDRKRITPLLRFQYTEGRLQGLALLALLYPGAELARLGDPAGAAPGSELSSIRHLVSARISAAVESLVATAPQEGPEDDSWYWAAPMLLDAAAGIDVAERLGDPSLLEALGSSEDHEDEEGENHIDLGNLEVGRHYSLLLVGKTSRTTYVVVEANEDSYVLRSVWRSGGEVKHGYPSVVARSEVQAGAEDERYGPRSPRTALERVLARAAEVVEGPHALGRVPDDLVDVLTDVAISAPGTCSLRALARICGGVEQLGDRHMFLTAAKVAWSLRSLFNLPESMALLRAGTEEAYWRLVLRYCLEGNLQAVLDEYAHVLPEWLGLIDEPPAEKARLVSDAMTEAIGLRTSTYGVDHIEVSGDRLSHARHGMRARFAVRFGDEKSESGIEPTRASHVRSSFNSPFWPFVLVTTSVGQEGLDFHLYCHAVVHWNLPSNPVDLEQREGRVHRYKGHAVRKNVARRYGSESVGADDPWAHMFERAAKERADDENDLVPYWVYVVEGGTQIERYVPALPLSREEVRLHALKRTLAAYRIVFGQPRQEDLIEYLKNHIESAALEEMLDKLRIEL